MKKFDGLYGWQIKTAADFWAEHQHGEPPPPKDAATKRAEKWEAEIRGRYNRKRHQLERLLSKRKELDEKIVDVEREVARIGDDLRKGALAG